MNLQELLILTHEEMGKNKNTKTELDDFRHKDKIRRFKDMRDHEALFHTAHKSDEFYKIMSQKMNGHYSSDEIKSFANFFFEVKQSRLGDEKIMEAKFKEKT